MLVEIYTLIGENCITLEDGQKVYDLILPELTQEHPVELNFEGVRIFASPFFNAAIGRLVKDFKAEDLNRLIRFTNLNQVGSHILRRVIENAKQYYGADEQTRRAVDDILNEQSKSEAG